MVTKYKRAAAAALGVLLFLAGGFLLFLPFPRAEERRDGYLVRWEDGTETAERYADLADLVEGVEGGFILIRSDKLGRTAADAALAEAVSLFSEGSLLELLNYRGELTRLDRLALYREFGDTVYYSGDTFAWDGERFARTDREIFARAVLLDGSFPAGALARMQAEELVLRSGAQFSAKALVGSKVVSVEAQPPYRREGDILFLDSVSGTRLVAVLPAARTVKAEFDYLDRDALAACADAEEIDFCSVAAERIGQEAFAACNSLRLLHTTVENPVLAGEFKKSKAPCGCFIYERS